MFSQHALGWHKVCCDVDKYLSLPSLYGYRLAIGYLRDGEREGESYPSFCREFGDHSKLLCYWFSLQEVMKLAGQPVEKTAVSTPCGAMQTPEYVRS